MNILAASQVLFEWFSENNSFCFAKNFDKICPKVKDKERDEDEGAIILALTELKRGGIIKLYLKGNENPANAKKEGVWILSKPFEAYEQEVSISGMTSLNMARVINDFCEVIGDKTQGCNPSNISEKDITNILQICSILADRLRKIENGEEEEETKESNKK